MTFTVKAEYKGSVRRFTFNTIPRWTELYDQLYKVFRIDGSICLSHLLLSQSEESPSSHGGRILIAIDVKDAEAYHTAVDPFVSTHGNGGMLKFSVNDLIKRKEPLTSNSNAGASSVPVIPSMPGGFGGYEIEEDVSTPAQPVVPVIPDFDIDTPTVATAQPQPLPTLNTEHVPSPMQEDQQRDIGAQSDTTMENDLFSDDFAPMWGTRARWSVGRQQHRHSHGPQNHHHHLERTYSHRHWRGDSDREPMGGSRASEERERISSLFELGRGHSSAERNWPPAPPAGMFHPPHGAPPPPPPPPPTQAPSAPNPANWFRHPGPPPPLPPPRPPMPPMPPMPNAFGDMPPVVFQPPMPLRFPGGFGHGPNPTSFRSSDTHPFVSEWFRRRQERREQRASARGRPESSDRDSSRESGEWESPLDSAAGRRSDVPSEEDTNMENPFERRYTSAGESDAAAAAPSTATATPTPASSAPAHVQETSAAPDFSYPSLQHMTSRSSFASSTPSTVSSAVTVQEEVKGMLDAFVGRLNETLAKNNLSELTLVPETSTPQIQTAPAVAVEKMEVDDSATEKAEGKGKAVDPKEVTGLHPNIVCDNCSKDVVGVRHKCSNCPDYDLCNKCFTEGANEKHSLYHHFNRMLPPVIKQAPANQDKEKRLAPAIPPKTVHKGRKGGQVRHSAICDSCDKTIFGVRHKCATCEDYDLCDRCYINKRIVHNIEHTFQHHSSPIVRNRASVPPPKLAPPPVRIVERAHPAHCNVCDQSIRGIRHKCLDCLDYDMCDTCLIQKRSQHDLEHKLIALHDPTQKVVLHVIRDDEPSAMPTREDVNDQTSSAVEHNAYCDLCRRNIRGARWKCVDCVDYDMCSECMLGTAGTIHYEGKHQFVKMASPGKIVVHRVKEDEATPAPAPAHEAAITPRPVETPFAQPIPVPAPVLPATPVIHDATCNLCDSRIIGPRFKCTGCPDFDTCEKCFAIVNEQHPNHSFIKVSNPNDVTVPREQFLTVHNATCDSCQCHIIGIRYKCLHPDCHDFDLCAHCEALPLPVHPVNHPLVKFKTDYSEQTAVKYENVFSFVRGGGLMRNRNTPGIIRIRSPTRSQPSETPSVVNVRREVEVEVLIPRPEEEENLLHSTSQLVIRDSKDLIELPSVPTEEPRLIDMEVADVGEAAPVPVLELADGSDSVVEMKQSPAKTSESPFVRPAQDDLLVEEPVQVEMKEQEKEKKLSAVFVTDNSVDDGHVFPTGVEFVKSWRVRNDGSVAWPESTVIAFMGGDRLGVHEKAGRDVLEYPVGHVEPGVEVDVLVEDMKAPAVADRYVSYWSLKDKSHGTAFGDRLWCDIAVEEPQVSDNSMSSSSIILPTAAPEEERQSLRSHAQVSPHHSSVPPLSPSTLRSSSPTWSGTDDNSMWEDARPSPTGGENASLLTRRTSQEFVFVEDESDDGH